MKSNPPKIHIYLRIHSYTHTYIYIYIWEVREGRDRYCFSAGKKNSGKIRQLHLYKCKHSIRLHPKLSLCLQKYSNLNPTNDTEKKTFHNFWYTSELEKVTITICGI